MATHRIQPFYIPIFLLFTSLLLVGGCDKGKLAGCDHEDCLRKEILAPGTVDYPEKDCQALDGKPSKSSFTDDLGKLCRLFIARKQVIHRKQHNCPFDYKDLNPDFSLSISSLNQWLYSDALFAAMTEKERVVPRINSSSNNNSTIYQTYVLTRFANHKKDDKKVNVKFHTYFCITEENGQNFYTPYFSALHVKTESQDGKSEAKGRYTVMNYLANPPLMNETIIQQIPSKPLKSSYKLLRLNDLNKDGKLDLVFLDAPSYKSYKPGVCLAQPGKKSCKVIQADKATPKSEYFMLEVDIEVTSGKGLTVIYKDEEGKKPEQRFDYHFRNGTLSAGF